MKVGFKKFLQIFPPPQFLSLPYIALVFSDSHVRALRLNTHNFHPEFFSEVELKEGIIEAGIVQKPDFLGEVLQLLASSFTTPYVKFAVPDEVSYVFSAKVPVTPGKTARESVSFILEENVPLPLSDISFDFTPLRIERSAEGFSGEVTVTAVSSSIVANYVRALEIANLQPILCINESEAIAKAVIPAASVGYNAIVYAHRDTVGIYIAEGSHVEFSSIVQLPSNSSPELFVSFVSSEFSKSLSYWKEKRVNRREDQNNEKMQVFLCGSQNISLSLKEALSKMEHISVSMGNVWVNAFSLDDFIPKLSFEEALKFGGAIGLFV